MPSPTSSLQEVISFRTLLGIIILTASAFRLATCFLYPPTDYIFSDPGRHWVNAGNFFSPHHLNGYDPLAYQLYLGAVRFLSQDAPWAISLITGLLSTAMPWFYYRAAREFHLGKTPALCVWAFIALMPSLLTVYSYFLHATLLIPLIGLGLWMTGRYLRKGGRLPLLWATLVWTLALMTKQTALPLAFLCLSYSWWQKSRRPSDLVLAAGLMAALLLPNAFRTQSILGFPAPLGTGWIAKLQYQADQKHIRVYWDNKVYQFSSPSCYVAPFSPFNDWRIRTAREESVYTTRIKSFHGEQDWLDAYEKLHTSWPRWFERWGENMLLFLFAPSWPEAHEHSAIGRLNLLNRWLWAPLLLVVLIGNACFFWQRKFHLIPAATTLLALALLFQNTYPMEGRYRKPLEPLLVLNLVWLAGANLRRKDPARHLQPVEREQAPTV